MAGLFTRSDDVDDAHAAAGSWRSRYFPAFWPVGCFVSGLALSRTDVLDVWPAFGIVVAGSLLLLWRHRALLLGMFWLGLLLGVANLLHDAYLVQFDERWVVQEHQIKATVQDVRTMPNRQRLRLRDITDDQGHVLRGLIDVFDYGNPKAWLPGQRLALRVRLHRPQNSRNPGAFDYRGWCFDHHIALVGSVRGSIRLLDAHADRIAVWRARIHHALTALPQDAAAVLNALLLADRSMIDNTMNAAYSATGTAHLLAISGLHMGLVAGLFFWLCRWVLTRREAWIVRWPVHSLSLLVGLLAAFCYGTLAGWPLPAMRASMMLGLAVLAWWWSKRSDPLHGLLLALGMILLFDPSAIGSLSLWLSFLATFTILVWGRRVAGRHDGMLARLRMLLWVSLLAMLATLPLVTEAFGRLPLYSLPANLLLVPLYALWILPLALLGELLVLFGLDIPAHTLLLLSGQGAEFSYATIRFFHALPGGDIIVARPTWLAYTLFVPGMLLAGYLVLRGSRRKALLTAVLATGCFCGILLWPENVAQPRWIIWDAGQGAASTLLLPEHEIINIDVPGSPGSRFNGGSTVSEGLRAMGYRHIDVLVISHAQQDHAGGVPVLLSRLGKVGELWLPDADESSAMRQLLMTAAAHGIVVRRLGQGDRWRWRGYTVEVLWPPHHFHDRNRNNHSLVLIIHAGGRRLLFAGDIEARVERELLAFVSDHVDMMLMPHHGSRTSSSRAFVQALAPSWVVAQTGRNNRYHFPADTVVRRYREQGAEVLNTADGAIMFSWYDAKRPPDIVRWHDFFSLRRSLALQWWRMLL